MKVGDLVKLSSHGKNIKEFQLKLPEIFNSCGIITAVNENRNWKSVSYHVGWCLSLIHISEPTRPY